MSSTGAVLVPRRAACGGRAALLPQLLLAVLCGGYTTGAALGWGSNRLALVMGDFGLAGASLTATVSALLYARRAAGPHRPAWVLFALSSAMLASGNAVWGWYEVVLREPVPRTSAADFCFLMFAPPAITGLLVLAKRPVTRAGWVCLALDTWLIGGSLLTLSWSLALARAAEWDGRSTARIALSLAYPLLDIVLVSMVLALHFRRSAANRAAVNTAIAALALTVLCDALFTSPLLRAHYRSGQILDAGWFAGAILMAYAPWVGAGHRSEHRHHAPRTAAGAATRRVTGSLTALTPYLAAGVCTLGILYNVITGQKCDRVVLFTGCTVVMALVVRQGIMLLDNIALTQELAQKESHFRSLVQGSSDVIMIAAPSGVLRYVSPAAQGVYGRDPGELVGTELAEHIHPEDLGRVVHEVRRFLAAQPGDEPATRIECRIRSGRVREGRSAWLHVESSVNRYQGGLIFNSRDVTERVALQAQLLHNASHDPLTDLPNRTLFTEVLGKALGGRRAGDGRAAVLYVDLDGFKAVNDTVGHQAGDDLLTQAARRLQGSLRSGDTAARLGGDEFAVLISGPDTGHAAAGRRRTRERQVREIAGRLLGALSEPYHVDGAEVRVSASIGVAFARPGDTPGQLMRNADLAMYRAKRAGKGRVELYAPHLQAEAVRRTELAGRLRKALHDGGFTLLHQPVVELSCGRIAGVEAYAHPRAPRLARTDLPHPPGPGRDEAGRYDAAPYDSGPLDAGPYDPGPYDTGAYDTAPYDTRPHDARAGRPAVPGRWLLEQAVEQAAQRYRAGHRVPVTVRLSARRLVHRELPARTVETLLDRHELPPGGLLLEITGGDPHIPHDELDRRLGALRALGVRIALGGFGAGHGALAALRAMPVDVLKLDRCFVDGLLGHPAADRRRSVTQGLLRIAADLGVPAVADGVDRPEQVHLLREMGCAHGVGMAFAGPLDEQRLRGSLSRGAFPVPRGGALEQVGSGAAQCGSGGPPGPDRRSHDETPVPPA